jgi:hypothetical protein
VKAQKTEWEKMKNQKQSIARLGLLSVIAGSILFGGGSVRLFSQQASEPQSTTGWQTADSLFRQPYIDVDEWRDKPVRHRYVHGGFKGTEAPSPFTSPQRNSTRADSSSTSHRRPQVKRSMQTTLWWGVENYCGTCCSR